jgi:hypothetical protein
LGFLIGLFIIGMLFLKLHPSRGLLSDVAIEKEKKMEKKREIPSPKFDFYNENSGEFSPNAAAKPAPSTIASLPPAASEKNLHNDSLNTAILKAQAVHEARQEIDEAVSEDGNEQKS